MAISIAVVGEANMSEFKKAQRELDALRRAAEKSGKAQASTWDRTAGSVKKHGREMQLAGVATLVGLGLSARAAEEAEQANARLEQVFRSMGDASGEGAEQAKAQADELSRLIGVDDEVIKSAQAKLATFQAVSDEQARANGIFERATKASADLAATGFGSMESASVMLGKALQDPVKGITALTRVGVTFTAQEKENIKTLAESGKGLEAQRIILAAVEKQVGGVAEASATGSAKLQVAWGEFQESVGNEALPAFEALVSGGTEMLDLFGDLPGPVKTATVAVAGVGGAALVAAPQIVAAVQGIQAMRASAAAANTTMLALAGSTAAAVAPYAALAAVVGSVAYGIHNQTDAAQDATKAWDDLLKKASPDALNDLDPALTKARESVLDWAEGTSLADKASDQWNKGITVLTSAFSTSNDVLEQAEQDIRNQTQAQSDLETVISRVAKATGLQRVQVEAAANSVGVDLTGGVDSAVGALMRQVSASQDSTVATEQTSAAWEVLNDAVASATDKTKAYRQALDGLDGGYVDVQAAQDSFHASVDAVTDGLKENGRTLDAGTEKGRANRQALRDLADKSRDLATATYEQTGSMDAANGKMQRGRTELIRVARQMGLTEKQAKEYADQLGLIPNVKKTKVDVDTKAAQRKLKGLYDYYGSEPLIIPTFTTINPDGSKSVSKGRGMGRAGGGDARGMTLVGERGPELVHFDGPARVIDAGQTSRMLSAPTPAGIVINGGINIAVSDPKDGQSVRREVESVLSEVLMKRGQGVRR